jgi:sugar-specific transcriptional regulator TrmB
MKRDHLKKTLAHLGLHEKEAEIYLALLSSKTTSSVSELERKVSLGRTAIYFHLKSLLEKDVIREDKRSKVSRFRAVSPTVLHNRLKHWSSDFESILPTLEGLSILETDVPETTVRQIDTSDYEFYTEIAHLPEGSEFRVIQSAKSVQTHMGGMTEEQWKIFHSTIAKRNIQTRGIFPPSVLDIAQKEFTKELYTLLKKRTWHMRLVEEGFHDFELVFIYGDKASFFLADVGVILTIHHKRMTQILMAMFDALWLSGRPGTWR